MSEEDDVWYCAYKCVGCNYTTLDDDPDCVKCKKTGCMMAFMINQDDEDEDEEECEVCCLTDCACVICKCCDTKRSHYKELCDVCGKCNGVDKGSNGFFTKCCDCK